MKYLIVGLGNIGNKYEGTRHNVGFEVLDHFAKKHSGKFEHLRFGSVCRIKFRGRQLVLLKPDTFMNLSGKAIKYWMQKEKIPLEQLLVVVDDIHLDLGVFRLRAKGSAGGHNGLQDILERLSNTKFARLRIGIGNDFQKGRQVDFVLGHWTEEELNQLPQILERSAQAIESFVFRGLANTMNAFNR